MDNLFDYQYLLMTVNEEKNFSRALECYICQRRFNNDKVHDQEELMG